MGCFNCIKKDKEILEPLQKRSTGGNTACSDNNKHSLSTYSSNLLINNHSSMSLAIAYKHKRISEEDFEKIKLLGKGTFGKVLLVRNLETDKLYAMKVLDKSSINIMNQEDHTKTERKILENIKHPFIVTLHFAFQNEKKLYLLTEFMQGGELFYHLRKERRFDEEKAKFYICEILLALDYLHSNNCIYRDLKPENILLGKDGHIKITDFGLSKQGIKSKEGDKAFTICGTPEYLAPEIILDKKGYNNTVDWWSLGVLLYDMLVGYSPFKQWDNNTKEQSLGYDASIYLKKVYLPKYHTPEARDLIERLITVDPKNRLGANGSQEIKKHPFFSNINWTDVLNKKLTPPFKPLITHETDLNNFHAMFTEENIENTLPIKSELNAEDDYEGFTYVNKNALLENNPFPNVN